MYSYVDMCVLMCLFVGIGWEDKGKLTGWPMYAKTKHAENDGFIYMV